MVDVSRPALRSVSDDEWRWPDTNLRAVWRSEILHYRWYASANVEGGLLTEANGFSPRVFNSAKDAAAAAGAWIP